MNLISVQSIRESLLAITKPRLFRSERGFQGQLVSNLNAKLNVVDIREILVEEEYQKVSKLHNWRIRPDIIIHIPFEGSGLENRRQGNLVAFELKLRATQESAFEDFDKLERMKEFLDYPLGIFINIDSSETFLENYAKRTEIELYSFAVLLEDNQVSLHEYHL